MGGWRLAGDPTVLRLCLERIVGPYRERVVEFGMPPIPSATPRSRKARYQDTLMADGCVGVC